MMRVGFGFDTHEFAVGKSLVLGGVQIPHTHGLKAHSDGDAVIHAVVDAILGALAKGDIGGLFPDTALENAGRNSREFLQETKKIVDEAQAAINNIDITIIAEKPNMAPYKALMVANIAKDLAIDIGQVNVKATRNEGMGHLGRAEGLAVHAVVLLTVQ